MNAASKTTAVQVALDSNSLIGLTNKVSNGNITWTPPDNGTWLLISYRMRGTVQPSEAGPHNDPDGSVIDHFSQAGSEASIQFWENTILSPGLRNLFQGRKIYIPRFREEKTLIH
jgi:hypothetical protein